LQHIEKYTNLEEAKHVFDKYLPYAIAFGLERGWVQKFATVGAPAPTWYDTYPPVIHGGPHHHRRDVPPGTGAGPVFAGGGERQEERRAPDLQQTSDSMARSLQGMSDGLASMLNIAGSILSSAPSSSSGGGWSGGGGRSGGGGGGGGGSGFN